MATLIDERAKEFKVTHLEMIKVCMHHRITSVFMTLLEATLQKIE